MGAETKETMSFFPYMFFPDGKNDRVYTWRVNILGNVVVFEHDKPDSFCVAKRPLEMVKEALENKGYYVIEFKPELFIPYQDGVTWDDVLAVLNGKKNAQRRDMIALIRGLRRAIGYENLLPIDEYNDGWKMRAGFGK